MKSAMGRLIGHIRGTSIKIVAAVHDEILLEVKEEEAAGAAEMLTNVMEQAGSAVLTRVPCVAEATIADTWAGK